MKGKAGKDWRDGAWWSRRSVEKGNRSRVCANLCKHHSDPITDCVLIEVGNTNPSAFHRGPSQHVVFGSRPVNGYTSSWRLVRVPISSNCSAATTFAKYKWVWLACRRTSTVNLGGMKATGVFQVRDCGRILMNLKWAINRLVDDIAPKHLFLW